MSSFDLAVLRGDTVPEENQGQIIGTARYMAPEQATGHVGQISPATDIHALGILLHELLTGQPLFAGETPQELLEQVVNRVPRPPSQARAGVPHALDAICLKCLEKQPGRRYPTAAVLADDLHRFVARRGGLWTRLFGWVRGST